MDLLQQLTLKEGQLDELDIMLEDAKIAASEGTYIARYIPVLVEMVRARDAEIQRIIHWREKGRKWGV